MCGEFRSMKKRLDAGACGLSLKGPAGPPAGLALGPLRTDRVLSFARR
jgi:hypothetical protein